MGFYHRNQDEPFSSQAGKFGSAATDAIRVLQVPTASLTGSVAGQTFDPEAIRSFTLSSGTLSIDRIYPQFTRLRDNVAAGAGLQTAGTVVEFVVSGGAQPQTPNGLAAGVSCSFSIGPDNLNDRGDFEDSTAPSAGSVSALEIPEINVQLRSDTVAAKTRKLKAQWTPEFAQDLNAYHSIDAEAELTSILSEYISMEIDLEILDMLIRNADTVEGWSATVAQDVSVSSNNTAGGSSAVTYTSTQNNQGVYILKCLGSKH